jgi:outer membrane receptor protein involved in Fe transport
MSLGASFLATLAFFQGGSAAGTRDGETVVTARKQEEPLATLPLSATVVAAEEFDDGGVRTPRDAAARIPNVFFSEFSARRLSFPFVRGLGSGLNDPAVITYVDDVPQFGFGGTNLPLFALERVEFLRGPQGTLYGKNALGGLIHVRGRRPARTPELDLGATFGSFDLGEYSGSFSGPLLGGGADFGLLSSEREGYTENDFSGRRVDERDGLFGRARMLWNLGTNSELEFAVFGENARDGGFVLSDLAGLRADPHHINQDFEGLANRDVLAPSLVYRRLGDTLDFTSVSAWQTWDVLETSDFDFSPIDGVRRRAEEEQDYAYQELRIGTAADARRGEWRWLAGVSAFVSNSERQAANQFRPGGAGIFFPPGSEGVDFNDGQFDDTGLAVFGELSVPLGTRLELGAGLRYDREDKEIERLHTFDPGTGPIVLAQGEEDESFDEVLPSASASFALDRATNLFARAAKGFKAGGFNLSAPAGSESFEAETAWSYELGLRRSFDDERARLGATVFLIDWQDMQLALFDATAGGYIANAGESESRGFELEGAYRTGDWLDLDASFGWLDTEIEAFTDPFGNDTSGNELPQAPETTLEHRRDPRRPRCEGGRPARQLVSARRIQRGGGLLLRRGQPRGRGLRPRELPARLRHRGAVALVLAAQRLRRGVRSDRLPAFAGRSERVRR